MLIRAGFEIVYDCPAPTPMLTLLSVHPSRRSDLKTPDDLMINGAPIERQFLDRYGNLCGRTLVPPGRVTLTSDFTIRDSGLPDPAAPWAEQAPVQDLPDDVLIHLRGSRYCETDRLSDLACGSSAGLNRAGTGCRRSSTTPTIKSASAMNMRGPPRPRSRRMRSAGGSAATSPTWPSPCAAA